MHHFGLGTFFSRKHRLARLKVLRKQAIEHIAKINQHRDWLVLQLSPGPANDQVVWTMSAQMADTRDLQPIYSTAMDRISRLKVEFKELQDCVTMYEVAGPAFPRRILANLPLYGVVQRNVNAINAIMSEINQDVYTLHQLRLNEQIESELPL